MDNLIVKQMSRSLFVAAYADAIEQGELEGDGAGPGQDWMDVAPETPERFLFEAWRLTGKIEQINRMSLICLFAQACKADGESYEDIIARWHDDALTEADWKYLNDFGHYLAMQSLGHGVSWFDDHEKFPLHLPLIECVIVSGDVALPNSGQSGAGKGGE